MDMVSYLLGEDVGNQRAASARNVANIKLRSKDSTIETLNRIIDDKNIALKAVAAQRDKVTERFLRERQEREVWQKTATLRKMMLVDRGMTEQEVYAEQHKREAVQSVEKELNDFLDRKSAEIDADMKTKGFVLEK
ncbi:hypothetical protein AB4090_04815 [Acidithiobacillus sp. IBUN Pt1247-S3]|uniref:hypothetical protein n=1 Tax=Acidithiobacillus sp. IBUN Pt1247-S3 TaxID=3166642 RepID=UPI0034E427FC